MTIAVHIALPDPLYDISSHYNYNCFTVLAAMFPEKHFIFIFDKPFQTAMIKEKNITPVLSGPPVRNRLLQHYFYNFKVPRLLNKYNADLFVSTGVCSLRTKVPQLLIVDDLSFLQKKSGYSRAEAGYLKRYTGFFVRKAALIGVMNVHLKKTLHQYFSEDDHKISVLKYGIDPVFKPCTYEAAEQTRERFTGGKEYFLLHATASTFAHTIPVLKAFSIFKKWQQSGMKLVILFPAMQGKNEIPGLETYKYRSDVTLLTAENKAFAAAIMASAYAAIHLPAAGTNELEGLMSIACLVPLITIGSDHSKSLYGDTVVYSSIDEKDIAKNLQYLYKDEQSRNDLVNRQKAFIAAHSWQHAAGLLWQTIASYSAASPTFAKK